MAIDTLGTLQTAIQNWTKRPGAMVSARTTELIGLFEASANATIRIRENEIDAPLTATVNSPLISLPSNYQAPVSLKVTSDQRELKYVTPDVLPYYPSQSASERWTVTESKIKTERDADQAYAYTFRYHKVYALASGASGDTNSLLTRYPNVYLYGSLLEAAPYLRDLSVVGLWQNRYDKAMGELKQAEAEQKKMATLAVDPALLARPAPFNINRGY